MPKALKAPPPDKIAMPAYTGPWPLPQIACEVILAGVEEGLPLDLALARARVSKAAWAALEAQGATGGFAAKEFLAEIERAEAEFAYDAMVRACHGLAGGRESFTALSRRFRAHFALKAEAAGVGKGSPIEALSEGELAGLLGGSGGLVLGGGDDDDE